jgi:hypothetical protein
LLSGVFHLTPDSSRYRAIVSYSQKSGTGAGAVLQDASVTSYLTLIQRDTVSGTIAEFRIDSLKVAPGKSTPTKLQGNPALARGLIYRATIVKGVPIGGFQLSAANPQADLLTSALANLYPGFKATLKAGDTWADTTIVKSDVPVVQDKTTISSWKVTALSAGDIVVDVTTAGSFLTRSQTSEVTGTMSGKRHLAGPINGPMTSAMISSDSPVKSITGTAAPISVAVKTTTTITRLP